MIHWIYRGPISVSTSWWHELPILRHYGWWTKSCTTWNVWNPINHGVFTISTFAGFLPSTVCTYICLGWIYHAFFVSGIFVKARIDGLTIDRHLKIWPHKILKKTYSTLFQHVFKTQCSEMILESEHQRQIINTLEVTSSKKMAFRRESNHEH